jgi:alkanesulfonate monooxygenase SsuD/methylene tetrahydromethanopterin reductase-like flavin-dependent oxidoreductase (luciferase family)
VGDEDSVARQIRALFEAGATDVCAAPFPVGDDATVSRARTRALLTSLARD